MKVQIVDHAQKGDGVVEEVEIKDGNQKVLCNDREVLEVAEVVVRVFNL